MICNGFNHIQTFHNIFIYRRYILYSEKAIIMKISTDKSVNKSTNQPINKSINKLILALIILAGAFMVAACTSLDDNTSQSPPEPAVMRIENYGGFIAPSMSREVFQVESTRMLYTTYDPDGNVTSYNEFPITAEQYDSLLSAFVDNNFTSLNPEYVPATGIGLPDVGVTNITLIADGLSYSVFIKPSSSQQLPDQLANIIDAMDALRQSAMDSANAQDQSKIISLEYSPMQCEETPWGSWLANSSIRFIMAPTEKQVIMMYYSNVYDITVLNVTQINSTEATCMACSVCPKAYTLVADVFDVDAGPLASTGWKVKTQTDLNTQATQNANSNHAGIANPASAYCVNQGYNSIIKTNADGSQTGYCDFGNGKQCEEWTYYRGECGAG
jgi:putative hemolysin